MTDESEPEEPNRPPSEMYDLVQELIRRDYGGPQKRQTGRHPVVMEVPSVLLDERLQPIGPPFVALSRDISTSGMSLIHTAPIRTRWVRLKIEGKGLEALINAKVVRCRQLRQFFEIGCEFVSRIDFGECADLEWFSRPDAIP